MTLSKIYKNDFLAKFVYIIKDPILKYHYKFQLHIPINARVRAVPSLENFYTFILQWPCW